MKILIERNPIKDQRGFSLIEVMLSIALLGILAVSFLSALGTGSMVLFMTDQRQTAKNLAESQMEHVKNQKYILADDGEVVYEKLEIDPDAPGYTIWSVNRAEEIVEHIMGIPWNSDPEVDEPIDNDVGLQKVTVIIKHHGEEVTRLEGYKAK